MLSGATGCFLDNKQAVSLAIDPADGYWYLDGRTNFHSQGHALVYRFKVPGKFQADVQSFEWKAGVKQQAPFATIDGLCAISGMSGPFKGYGENLNAMEEAEALQQLKSARGYTDEMLARVVGKSRQAVNDSLRLNNLPVAIREECRTGGIGTKRQLLSVLMAGSPEEMAGAWEALKSGEVSTVRGLQARTAGRKPKKPGRPKNFVFALKDKSLPFTLNLAFKKPNVQKSEVIAAVRELLRRLEREG